ncbi:MAG: ribosomal RNA small subunit methyltransferase A [Candidatus Riflebacteria bacterium]|nr:ribosomal RNA small subunit methyltransferase A [Candidatus Riflebacteria bacterium]
MKAKQILAEIGIEPKKSLGQNFCVDENLSGCVFDFLKTEVEKNNIEEIWEIGPGLGALSEKIFELKLPTRLFEIDQRLKSHLEKLCSGFSGAELHWGDFLEVDADALSEKTRGNFLICGNLPYSCGTAIIRKAIALKKKPAKMLFLLQREVSKKASAKPATDDYGFLSAAVQLFAEAKSGATFSQGSFYPNPKVLSSLLELTPLKLNSEEIRVREKALNIASVTFSQRRKASLSVLKKNLPISGESWEDKFERLKIPANIRFEAMPLELLIKLAESIECIPEKK